MSDPFAVRLASSARRHLESGLPEAIAVSVWEFISGPLSLNPHRVGRRLAPPLSDQHSARRGLYRILYVIDDEAQTVTILKIDHRRDVYRV